MKPEKVFRIGSSLASVFLKEIKTDSGEKKIRQVKLQRSFRDGDEWKYTSYFSLAEMAQAMAVLKIAMDYVASQEAEITESGITESQ